MKRRQVWVWVGAILLLVNVLVACGGGATVVGVEQSGGDDEPGTEFIPFAADSFPVDGAGETGAGMCVPSQAVPGTYRCRTEPAGETVDPCFRLASGDLLCEPDPVAGEYALLLRPTGPLPALSAPPADANPFFVELEGDVPTCALRTGTEPVVVAGVEALYDCDAPYTYLMGFEKSNAFWEAAMYVLDPATGGSSSGKIPTDVLRAWTVAGAP